MHISPPRPLWNARALLGEGPVWSPSTGCLYWVDVLGHKLHRYHLSTGDKHTWHFDAEISSLAERKDAPGLVVTLRREFAVFDLESGKLERLPAPERERVRNRFNDGKCDRAGRYWAGTMDFHGEQPSGALYRLDANRDCTRHVDGIAITNGPTWSADGSTLYLASTATREIFAFDFDPAGGALSNKRLWLTFADADGHPDGMTTDAEGYLWIAHWGAGCVTRHASDGRESLRISVPARFTTSCAFGGPDLRTLFITSACEGMSAEELEREPLAGSLFAVDLETQGVVANLCAV